jgi:hypothetical protein
MGTALSTQSAHFQRNTYAWRARRLETFPERVRQLAHARLEELDRHDYRQANQLCQQLARELKRAHVGLAFDEQELRDHAENYAQRCATLQALDPGSVLARLSGGAARLTHCEGPTTWLPVQQPPYAAEMRAFATKASFAASLGIEELPANRSNRYFGLSARLDDPLWWRRQLRKMWSRRSEEVLRKLGTVRRGADVYCSEQAVQLRGAQQRRMRRFLQSVVAVNEQGEALSLEQLAEHSLSNPTLRRGELMARLKGFEKIADELGWCGVFVTVTAPSYFHPQLFHGGINPRYGGASVRDAQRWLCATWARVRSQLDRDGVRYFGIRVAEPHHDGTPHWHMLLFVHRYERKALTKVIVSGWLKEYGTEPGAYKKRVTVKAIDPHKGSATGYLAKYIAKNLDGAGAIHAQEACETGVGAAPNRGHSVAVADGLSRVVAWASVHSIRQFQQLGGPPVGVYRETRRLRESVPDTNIERARGYADRGDWRGFCLASGYRFRRDSVDGQLERLWRAEQRLRRRKGLPRRRRSKTDLRLVYAETGRRNRYGELIGSQVIGLKWSAAEFFTRPHSWRIQAKAPVETVHLNSIHAQPRKDAGPGGGLSFPCPLGPVAITVRTATDDVDPAERFYSATESLIRQLACRFSLSERPHLERKWRLRAETSGVTKAHVRAETTGPPH